MTWENDGHPVVEEIKVEVTEVADEAVYDGPPDDLAATVNGVQDDLYVDPADDVLGGDQ